jgi:hypothetical protein
VQQMNYPTQKKFKELPKNRNKLGMLRSDWTHLSLRTKQLIPL